MSNITSKHLRCRVFRGFPMGAAAPCANDQGLKALVNFSPVMLFMKGTLVGGQT